MCADYRTLADLAKLLTEHFRQLNADQKAKLRARMKRDFGRPAPCKLKLYHRRRDIHARFGRLIISQRRFENRYRKLNHDQ